MGTNEFPMDNDLGPFEISAKIRNKAHSLEDSPDYISAMLLNLDEIRWLLQEQGERAEDEMDAEMIQLQRYYISWLKKRKCGA